MVTLGWFLSLAEFGLWGSK